MNTLRLFLVLALVASSAFAAEGVSQFEGEYERLNGECAGDELSITAAVGSLIFIWDTPVMNVIRMGQGKREEGGVTQAWATVTRSGSLVSRGTIANSYEGAPFPGRFEQSLKWEANRLLFTEIFWPQTGEAQSSQTCILVRK
jgi:hypothetical protein